MPLSERDAQTCAPKGLNRLAQGNALGKMARHKIALKGRKRVSCDNGNFPAYV